MLHTCQQSISGTSPPVPPTEIGPMIDPLDLWETAAPKIGPMIDPNGVWETVPPKIGPYIDPNGVWETA